MSFDWGYLFRHSLRAILLSVALLPANLRAEEREFDEVIAKVQPSVTTIRVQGRDGEEAGIGTGFVIDSAGIVATNFHVINEGRAFTVDSASGERLDVLAVEASDVNRDLALIRVDNRAAKLPALELATNADTPQGLRVLAFGNPHGLENSVVEGIVSATREIEGRDFLQLAMPVDPGNSGGPLVDVKGRVHGIINMKSAIDENLGFAIPIEQLTDLVDHPNPIQISRWVKINKIDEQRWTPLMGANWRQRGGRLLVSGLGDGFGGRSLLLSKAKVPEAPFEIAVRVRLDDESGAAGLVFHSDGDNKHYGFYPSGGRLRLSCFLGPSIYSWQVLEEIESEHYLPEQWNHLRVRVEEKQILCFVNGHQVIESKDHQLSSGRVGLAKFRNTRPEFSGFEVGQRLSAPQISQEAKLALESLEVSMTNFEASGAEQLEGLGTSGALSSRELIRRARLLEQQADQLRQLASDALRAETIASIRSLKELPADEQLLQGAFLIAKLDNPDLDIPSYLDQVQSMVMEIRAGLDDSASPVDTRRALHQYLFEENGFHGSRFDYYHAANSHLNRVMDDREGLPITLAVLYLELGRRLGLKLEGIGLPGHFVVGHQLGDDTTQLIDVFDRGKLLGQRDVRELVRAHTARNLRDSDLTPSDDAAILTRMLNNLVGIAGRNNDGESMLRYCDALVAIHPQQSQTRLMRAQVRAMTGRSTLAMQDLERLQQDPLSQADRERVDRLYHQLLDR